MKNQKFGSVGTSSLMEPFVSNQMHLEDDEGDVIKSVLSKNPSFDSSPEPSFNEEIDVDVVIVSSSNVPKKSLLGIKERTKMFISPTSLRCSLRNTGKSPLKESCNIRKTSGKSSLKKSAISKKAVDRSNKGSAQRLESSDSKAKNLSLPIIRCRRKKHSVDLISVETMSQILKKEEPFSNLDNILIIDCRFPFEFKGGHIRGSINIFTEDGIIERFFSEHIEIQKPPILVFHCEFSSERGPNLAQYLRMEDRKSNLDRYPSLHYPEIYVLEGGYKAFFKKHEALCEPQFYKTMDAQEHQLECQRYMSMIKTRKPTEQNVPTTLFSIFNTPPTKFLIENSVTDF